MIRMQIEQTGSATIDSGDLQALCPDIAAITEQFMRAAEIARAEDWEIDFRIESVVRFISPIAARNLTAY